MDVFQVLRNERLFKCLLIEDHRILLHTCTPMSLLHPDITVRLGYARLRVQKGHENASLGTQACIVTMTLFHCISVILLSQPVKDQQIHKIKSSSVYF